jgi:hypothetical protein
MSETDFVDYKNKCNEEFVIFPADELTRQRGVDFGIKWYNSVKKEDYDKTIVNKLLIGRGIDVPRTFDTNNIFVRPNTESAGCKGVYKLEGVCITEFIDIANEYVVDVYYDGEIMTSQAREVVLAKGYDKYIKFLENGSDVDIFARKVAFVLYKGFCNIQIIRDKQGKLYYVESSKRISGTSIVNILLGYNPFIMLYEPLPIQAVREVEYDKWYSYEQLLEKVYDKVYKRN